MASEEHVQEAIDRFWEELQRLDCDSCRVFVSKPFGEGDETLCLTQGFGNWYAQYGMIASWKLKQDRSEGGS